VLIDVLDRVSDVDMSSAHAAEVAAALVQFAGGTVQAS
jgi:hypothetical protein